MAAATAALIASAIIAATATGYQVSESESQKRRVKGKEEEVSRNAAGLEANLRGQQATAESDAAAKATQDAARKRQRRSAQGAQGFQSTLLTGPTGLQPATDTGSKTLLGL